MGASKSEQRGAVHREARNDDAATSSSATLLDHVDGYDEDEYARADLPPAYEEPDQTPADQGRSDGLWDYVPPPTPPFSNHDSNGSNYWTLCPTYSSSADALYNFVIEQAFYPPTYHIKIHGTHMEKSIAKDNRNITTDFLLRLNLAPYLRRDGQKAEDVLEILPINKRGYRGTRFPSSKHVLDDDLEASGSVEATLRSWCSHYIASRSPIKCFTFRRRVTNHDTTTLRKVITGAIQATGYKGHTVVTFPSQHETITVYSRGIINSMRTTTWIRYLFYFTFLWILSWPILALLTARYEVVEGVWEYADRMPGVEDQGEEDFGRERNRKCVVMSEGEWFKRWEGAIRIAAVGKTHCINDFLGEDYRQRAEDMRSTANELSVMRNFVPRLGNGNAQSDHVLALLEQGIAAASGVHTNAAGWGGDT